MFRRKFSAGLVHQRVDGSPVPHLSTQRRFLADAAHELHTVTALRLQAQLLKRSSNDEDRAEAMAELEADRSFATPGRAVVACRPLRTDGEQIRRDPVTLRLARSVVAAMGEG
jgi:hypothetical protein